MAGGCAGALGVATYPLTGIAVQDGAHAECALATDPDAAAPGSSAEPDPAPVPRRLRHQRQRQPLALEPGEPLTGYDRVIGDEEAERSLRTRIGLIQVQERIAGTDGLPGQGFKLRQLQEVALGNRQYAGELWRDELVELCESSPTQTGASGPVDVTGACPVLAAWDVHDNLDSDGAILFRRFVENLFANFQFVPTGVSSGTYTGSNAIWDEQFSAADPVNTPSGLNTTNPLVGTALADAVTDLAGRRYPARRAAARSPVRDPGRRADPDPRRPGSRTGSSTRSTSPWDPASGLLRTSPTARASSPR